MNVRPTSEGRYTTSDDLTRGYTTNSSGAVTDPINFAWYPWGGSLYATWAEEQMGWYSGCGSDQWNYRIYTGGTWQDVMQNSQRGGSCTGPRYHGRNFDGHHASCGCSDQWSVVDVHHESFLEHDIDMSWNTARNNAAATAYNVGFIYQQPNFTFLPLGQGNFQGYWADGWVTAVTG